MKRFFVFFTVPLMLLLGMVSCSNEDLPDSQSQPEPAENGYCLLFTPREVTRNTILAR